MPSGSTSSGLLELTPSNDSGNQMNAPPPFALLNIAHLITVEGTYKCPVCSIEKLNISTLKKHYAIHSLEKPFSCPYCSYRSTQNSSLYRHAQNIHKIHLARPGRIGGQFNTYSDTETIN